MDAIRIYDSDFVEFPELIDIATESVKAYRGNWDVLISFKKACLEGATLDERHARQVINALMADGTIETRRELARKLNDVMVLPGRSPALILPKPKLRVVRDPDLGRPLLVTTPANVKALYGRCITKQGNNVTHMIHGKSHVRWTATCQTFKKGHNDYIDREPTLRLYWVCGTYPSPRTEVVLTMEPEVGHKRCQKCLEVASIEDALAAEFLLDNFKELRA